MKKIIPLFLMFISCSPNISDLNDAIRNGNKDEIQNILNSDLISKTSDNELSNSLFLAIKENDKEIVQVLISSDIDINLKSVNGSYPINYATRLGHWDLVQLLIKNDSILDFEYDDYNYLSWLAKERREDELELIIKLGRFVNYKDSTGFGVLNSIILYSTDTLLKTVLSKVKIEDEDLDYLFHLAVRKEEFSKAQLLIDSGLLKKDFDCYSSIAANWDDEYGLILCSALYEQGITPSGSNAIFEAYIEENKVLFNWLIDHGASLMEPIPEEFLYQGSPEGR